MVYNDVKYNPAVAFVTAVQGGQVPTTGFYRNEAEKEFAGRLPPKVFMYV